MRVVKLCERLSSHLSRRLATEYGDWEVGRAALIVRFDSTILSRSTCNAKVWNMYNKVYKTV